MYARRCEPSYDHLTPTSDEEGMLEEDEDGVDDDNDEGDNGKH
jgi:hypothetical protein